MRTLVALALLMLLVPARAQDAGTTPLKVRKIVVYKHGVGYFERQGAVEGSQQVALSFRSAQMKDVLKSLFAVDLSGGRIGTVSYDTRDPLSKQLEDILIRLPQGNAYIAFLDQLQGVRVEVTLGDDSFSGSVIGTQPSSETTPAGTVVSYKLVLLRDDGRMQAVDLRAVSNLRILDEALQKDLQRILEISLKSKHADRKTVTLNATGEGSRQVRVGYIIETPIWKTSYRLLFDGDEKPLLQGWAILENTTDEDWEEVEVSFVAGSPMSFIMDLYTAYYPRRPEIPVGVAQAQGPQEGEKKDLTRSRRVLGKAAAGEYEEDLDAAGAPAGAYAPPTPSLAAALENSIVAAAIGQEVGELFSYTATDKVNLKRGQAALVPILSERIAANERIVFYRPSAYARPMNAYAFTNTTALTLESGPVTFFDGSTCIGEGLLRQVLKKGMKEVIPFAVEGAVTIETRVDHRSDPVTQATLAHGILTLTHRDNLETVYSIQSQLSRETALYLDHARAGGDFTLSEPDAADEEVDGQYRFDIALKPGAKFDFKVRETAPVSTQVALLGTPLETIRFYLSQKYLSDKAKAFIREVMQIQAQINTLRAQEAQMAQERKELTEDQERMNRALPNLQRTEEEIAMRREYVKLIQQAETRIKEIRTLSKENIEKRQGLEQELAKKVQEFAE